MMRKTGYVIFAHGSTVEAANRAVDIVAAQASREAGFDLYSSAFLDCAHPTLPEAVRDLVSRGASDVIVVPYFLTLGIHMQRDLPALVQELEKETPGLSIRVTAPLDGHPALSRIVAERALGA